MKTGLPHHGSRVEFGEFFFIPLNADKHPYGLDNSPRERAESDAISDRKLFELIVSQCPLRMCASCPLCSVSRVPDVHPRRLRPWFRMAQQLILSWDSALPK